MRASEYVRGGAPAVDFWPLPFARLSLHPFGWETEALLHEFIGRRLFGNLRDRLRGAERPALFLETTSRQTTSRLGLVLQTHVLATDGGSGAAGPGPRGRGPFGGRLRRRRDERARRSRQTNPDAAPLRPRALVPFADIDPRARRRLPARLRLFARTGGAHLGAATRAGRSGGSPRHDALWLDAGAALHRRARREGRQNHRLGPRPADEHRRQGIEFRFERQGQHFLGQRIVPIRRVRPGSRR